MKHPKWKQRALKQKADADAAQKAARYARFWEAVAPNTRERMPFDDEHLFSVPPQPNEVPF